MDGLTTFQLTYVPAYLRSGLSTFRLTYTSSTAHPTWLTVYLLSKRNIYFSLYVIGIFLFKKLISFSFLLSTQLKHVILLIAADIVHFSSHVQASHVMHFYMCVADSVSIFPPCVFLF